MRLKRNSLNDRGKVCGQTLGVGIGCQLAVSNPALQSLADQPDSAAPQFTHVIAQGEAPTLTPRDIASRYFERVAAFWATPDDPQALAAILELFADEVDWDIPGDLAAVPWIGPRRDREAVAAFYRELASQVLPVRFEVQKILGDGETAVAFGDLASQVRATGRFIESPFAFVLTISDGKITRYRMLEDSHAVAAAASA